MLKSKSLKYLLKEYSTALTTKLWCFPAWTLAEVCVLSTSMLLSKSMFFTGYLPTYLPFIYLSTYQSIYPSIHPSIHLSFFEFDNTQNEAILRLRLLQFWTWQHQKQSNSARLPSKWKVECRAEALVPMRFAFFPVHLSKVLRLPRKSEARSYEVLHLSRKIISANLKVWCSKTQPLSGNQRPHLQTAPMKMSLVLRLPRKMHLCRSSCPMPVIVFGSATKPPRFCSLLTRRTIPCACHAKRNLNVQKWSGPGVFCTFWLGNVLRTTTACTFSTSQLPKVVRQWCVLYILTWKCTSRHNGVHFFDISTSKSGLYMVCFVHFDFEMCFAPQRRALFRHLNFQKWSENGVFCTFWLRNALCATTACTFSTPPEPQIIGKTQCFATFLPFRAPASSFFWLFLFSDLLSSALLSSTLLFSLTLSISAFHLSMLSEVWLLNFLRLWFEKTKSSLKLWKVLQSEWKPFSQTVLVYPDLSGLFVASTKSPSWLSKYSTLMLLGAPEGRNAAIVWGL